MTRATTFAKLYNLLLMYQEEYNSLGAVVQERRGADLFEALIEEALELCEEADTE